MVQSVIQSLVRKTWQWGICLLSVGAFLACRPRDRLPADSLWIHGSSCEGKRVDVCVEHCHDDDALACNILARAYSVGFVVKKNLDTAISFFGRGCELGSGNSCYLQAHTLLRNMPPEPHRAFVAMSRACELGSPLSCAQLGDFYALGIGVDEDRERAQILYLRECRPEFTSACLSAQKIAAGEKELLLGNIYFFQDGSKLPHPDFRDIRRWTGTEVPDAHIMVSYCLHGEGRVRNAEIMASSGDQKLDEIFLKIVREQWSFKLVSSLADEDSPPICGIYHLDWSTCVVLDEAEWEVDPWCVMGTATSALGYPLRLKRAED